MKVLKFGGSSVGSPERIKALIKLLNLANDQIIVLSAVSGTTNTLEEISAAFSGGEKEKAILLIDNLYSKYNSFIQELFSSQEGLKNAQELISFHFNFIRSFSKELFTTIESKVILAQGELISTAILHTYLNENGINSVLLSALNFIKIDEENEPDINFLKNNLIPVLKENDSSKLFITQGFICRNSFGEIDNLKRGGSDYSASLIGAAIQADEIQIWTDISGMHNNDPRIINDTKPIANLCFDEAAELAYFGAKILHPQSIIPAKRYNIPVRVLNTLEPKAIGTLISKEEMTKDGVKAIAAKDNIIVIRIHSSRMLLAYGFLRRVFEVFERYKTPIDMITTSEVAISLTIDNAKYLEQIAKELKDFGTVDVDKEQTIICVVGDFGLETHGYASRVLDAVKHLTIRMISYGGSNYNISILLDTKDKIEALRSLHNRLF